MISVTSKSRYAVVAMAELARSGERPVPIAQIAERRAMPVQFLEQLFSTLRRDGLLTSQRGVKGGYTLARPPEEITVLEVVQALDGKVGEEAREAGGIWKEGVEALRDVFSRRRSPTSPAARPRRPAPACTTSRGRRMGEGDIACPCGSAFGRGRWRTVETGGHWGATGGALVYVSGCGRAESPAQPPGWLCDASPCVSAGQAGGWVDHSRRETPCADFGHI